MNYSRRILPVLLVFFIGLAVTGCSRISTYQKSIYDDNQEIASVTDSFFFAKRKENTKEEKLSVVFEKFSGKDTIFKIKAKTEGEIKIECSQFIEKGKFKVCLVNDNEEVYVIAEGDDDRNITTDIKAGVSYIKLIGLETTGKIVIKLKETDNIIIEESPMQ